jgi:hypothetical protein
MGQLLSDTGLALALIAFAWAQPACIRAVLVPGHWGDVLRIGSVCAGVWIVSGVLIRTGGRLQSSVSGRP